MKTETNRSLCKTIAILLVLHVSFAGATANREISATELMKQVEKQRVAENESSELSMILTSKNGKSITRKVERKRILTAQAREKSLIEFTYPSDVKGTQLLAHEEDKTTNRWLYLPVLKRVRRVPSGSSGDYFMSTDFTYEDLSREKLENFDYSYTTDSINKTELTTVIQATLKKDINPDESSYSKRLLWISSQNVIVKVQYFDNKGNHVKTLTAKDISKFSNSYRAQTVIMKNVTNGHSTTLSYNTINLEAKTPENLFSKARLSR